MFSVSCAGADKVLSAGSTHRKFDGIGFQKIVNDANIQGCGELPALIVCSG